jgi:asparagine synthase (glutamine-hydrolysing)
VVSAILMVLRSPDQDEARSAAAFLAAASRLGQRGRTPPREGTAGTARWAAAAAPGELESGATLVIRDTEPYLVERGYPGASVRYDARTGQATLARDALGAKPLFYAPCAGGWVVGSEVKLLTPFLDRATVNPTGLSDVVNFRWLLGADWLVNPVRQVLPGETVELTAQRPPRRVRHDPLRFAPDLAEQRPFDWHCARAEEALRAALRRAAADGELAILVSGGIDSSVLAALAVREGLPARAYIARYEGYDNPEYERARTVSAALRLPVEEISVPADAAADFLPHHVWRLEQPPRHANNVVLDRIFARVAERGGVVVHGDGAEMMFGLADYHTLRTFAARRRLVAPLVPLRRQRWLRSLLGEGRRTPWLDYTPSDYARIFDAIGYSKEARRLLDPLTHGRRPCPELSELIPDGRQPSHEQLQAYQTYTFLQCSLVRLDRLAAPRGVDVALPFLGADVVRLATALPPHAKARDGLGKPILRALCARYVSDEVAGWPKLGFKTPDRAWIMGPVSQRAGALFDAQDTALESVLGAPALAALRALDDHEARWLVVTLELTLRQLHDAPAAEPSLRGAGNGDR